MRILSALAVAIVGTVAFVVLADAISARPEPTGTVATVEARAPDRTYVFEQELPDGRTVLCVFAGDGSRHKGGAGLSCDWDRASTATPPRAPKR